MGKEQHSLDKNNNKIMVLHDTLPKPNAVVVYDEFEDLVYIMGIHTTVTKSTCPVPTIENKQD